ncbi:MAG: hypothetical protein ACJAXB_001017 [Candidatus Endobugula sp.]|jgi:hypothetical protein
MDCNVAPLKKGSYTTAFNESFQFVNRGQYYETAILNFAIDFTVISWSHLLL